MTLARARPFTCGQLKLVAARRWRPVASPVGRATRDIDGMLTDHNGSVAMHGDGTDGGVLTECGELGQRLFGADGARPGDQHSFV